MVTLSVFQFFFNNRPQEMTPDFFASILVSGGFNEARDDIQAEPVMYV